MTTYQRRFFALSVFALAFIFFYEARGVRLMAWGTPEEHVTGAILQAFFRQQMWIGAFVLVLGTLLLILLRRRDQKPAVPPLELAAYALGLGILLGTAYVSWVRVSM